MSEFAQTIPDPAAFQGCRTTCALSLPRVGRPACMALHEVLGSRTRLASRRTFLEQGGTTERFYLVAEGWVCLYVLLEDGRRQNIGFALPGELVGFSFDPHEILAYSAETITPATLCPADKRRAARRIGADPAILMRINEHLLWDQFRVQDLLTSIGRTSAIERVAHLLLMLFLRASQRMPEPGDKLSVPLTQQTISDTVGLSLEHVCRTLRHLKEDGILALERRQLTILDPEGLAEGANIEPDEVLQRMATLHGAA